MMRVHRATVTKDPDGYPMWRCTCGAFHYAPASKVAQSADAHNRLHGAKQ